MGNLAAVLYAAQTQVVLTLTATSQGAAACGERWYADFISVELASCL